MPSFSDLLVVGVETAFSVLAVAKRLMAGGKDVIELEIGDSPPRRRGPSRPAWTRFGRGTADTARPRDCGVSPGCRG